MTPRAMFLNTLHFESCPKRLPMIEWAAWWDETIGRWQKEGLDRALDYTQIQRFFDWI